MSSRTETDSYQEEQNSMEACRVQKRQVTEVRHSACSYRHLAIRYPWLYEAVWCWHARPRTWGH